MENILARFSPIFARRAGAKISRAEPSRAEKPPARAESELNRAELSSDASLVNMSQEGSFLIALAISVNV